MPIKNKENDKKSKDDSKNTVCSTPCGVGDPMRTRDNIVEEKNSPFNKIRKWLKKEESSSSHKKENRASQSKVENA